MEALRETVSAARQELTDQTEQAEASRTKLEREKVALECDIAKQLQELETVCV